MTREQLIAAVFVAIATVLGAGVPLLVALFKRLTTENEVKKLELEQRKADLLRATATDAVHYAEEKGEAEGLKGAERADLAETVVRSKLDVSAAEAKVAVRAAVGATPGIGATGKTDDDKPTSPPTLGVVALLLFAVLGSSACAHGSDGVRQACASTMTAAAAGYQAFTTWYKIDQAAIRAVAATDKPSARRTLEAHEPIAARILASLDVARDSIGATCSDSVFDAIDAGQRKDTAALIAHLTQIAADVTTAAALINQDVHQ